jgi:hypothetical protein
MLYQDLNQQSQGTKVTGAKEANRNSTTKIIRQKAGIEKT